MADETLNKGPEGEKLPESPAPDGPGAPPAPEQAEQVTLPGMGEGGPAPSGKVINLSDVRGDDDKGGKAPAVEAEKPEKRRGRPPKEQAEPKSPKAEKTAKPRAGRPPKGDKAARAEAQPSTRDKVSQSKKKTPEKGSGGMGPPKSPPKGKAGPVKAAAAPVPEINLPPTPAEPPRPVEEGKVVYLKLSELHAFHTFREHPYKVQDDTRTSPKGREVHLFSGFLKCADCGRAITRSVGNNNNVYYACSTYKNRSRTACTMHSIKHNRLEAAVLFAVQQQVHLAVSYSEMIARINTAPVKKSQSIRLEELIAAKERELAKISRYKQSLYQDWKDGEITQQDYRDMKADYERQIIALTDVLARLNAERAELANGVKSEHPALVAFTKHQNIDQLSRELLVELIDHIKVYENGNISVRFKFADEFRRIAEYIEINTTKPAVAG